MDKIDLDAILKDKFEANTHTKESIKDVMKNCMKEAIHQALVLASEKAKIKYNTIYAFGTGAVLEETTEIDKQSILDVEELII